MSIENKQSLAFVVSDIDFFFSHRIDLAKKLSDNFEIFVFTDCSEKDKSEKNATWMKSTRSGGEGMVW